MLSNYNIADFDEFGEEDAQIDETITNPES